jgi:hypothetical protein
LANRGFLATPAKNPWDSGALCFLGIVPKMRQAETFLATFGTDQGAMQFLAMISVLALLTLSGAAVSDRLLTADQHVAQGVE